MNRNTVETASRPQLCLGAVRMTQLTRQREAATEDPPPPGASLTFEKPVSDRVSVQKGDDRADDQERSIGDMIAQPAQPGDQ